MRSLSFLGLICSRCYFVILMKTCDAFLFYFLIIQRRGIQVTSASACCRLAEGLEMFKRKILFLIIGYVCVTCV